MRRRSLFGLISYGLLASLLLSLLSACGTGAGSGVSKEALIFQTSSLPVAYLGDSYQQSLQVSGGQSPYTLTVVSGSLPPGLKLSGTAIAGRPSLTGHFSFTVEVTDASLSTQVQPFTMQVEKLPPAQVSLQLPPTQIRQGTLVPLELVHPRGARALRVGWVLPFGATVRSVAPGRGGPIVLWKMQGQAFIAALGITRPLRHSAVIAYLDVSVDHPLNLSSQVAYRVIDAKGRSLGQQIFPERQPSAPTKTPSSTTVTPSSTTVTPSSTTVTPSSTTVTPSSTTKTPSSTTVTPSSTTVTPSSTTKTPSSTTVTPSSLHSTAPTRSPVTTPSSTTATPSAQTQLPASGPAGSGGH